MSTRYFIGPRRRIRCLCRGASEALDLVRAIFGPRESPARADAHQRPALRDGVDARRRGVDDGVAGADVLQVLGHAGRVDGALVKTDGETDRLAHRLGVL